MLSKHKGPVEIVDALLKESRAWAGWGLCMRLVSYNFNWQAGFLFLFNACRSKENGGLSVAWTVGRRAGRLVLTTFLASGMSLWLEKMATGLTTLPTVGGRITHVRHRLFLLWPTFLWRVPVWWLTGIYLLLVNLTDFSFHLSKAQEANLEWSGEVLVHEGNE